MHCVRVASGAASAAVRRPPSHSHCLSIASNASRGHIPTPWWTPSKRPSPPGPHEPVHVSLEHYLNPPQPSKNLRFAEAMEKLTPAENMVQLSDLFEARCQEGHVRAQWHPRMSRFVLGTRGGMHIIDMNETITRLRRAITVAQGVGVEGGTFLFLSTRPMFAPLAIQSANNCGQPFLVDKWLPGLLTNFEEVHDSLRRRAETIEQEGERFAKRKPRVARRIMGLQRLNKRPDVLFVMNVKENSCAIREAQRANVPVMAIVDTDCDPKDVSWPIPANDDHISSVGIVVDLISSAIREAFESRGGHIESLVPQNSAVLADLKALAELEELDARSKMRLVELVVKKDSMNATERAMLDKLAKKHLNLLDQSV